MPLTHDILERMAASALAGGNVVGVERDQFLQLIAMATSGRAFVERLLPYAEDTCDRGPTGAGYKSEALDSLCASAAEFLRA